MSILQQPDIDLLFLRIAPTSLAPSVIFEGEDYGLKVGISVLGSPREFASVGFKLAIKQAGQIVELIRLISSARS